VQPICRSHVVTQIGNDNFLDVLSQIRGPGSPAIAEWRRLQEVMKPLAKAAVLLPPMAFRWEWSLQSS
jgi:hypothetical protein